MADNSIKAGVYRIAIPALIKAIAGPLGLNKWLRERALRLPSEHIADAVDNANLILKSG